MTVNEHLAIASVPVQSWGRVYDENEALKNGTIFPELNKPFFAAGDSLNKGENMPDTMLLRIQKVSFAVDDVRLYLDTHPKDEKGLNLLKSLLKKRKELMKEYAEQFYPLTMDCMADIYEKNPDSTCYCWQEGRVPWEGECV